MKRIRWIVSTFAALKTVFNIALGKQEFNYPTASFVHHKIHKSSSYPAQIKLGKKLRKASKLLGKLFAPVNSVSSNNVRSMYNELWKRLISFDIARTNFHFQIFQILRSSVFKFVSGNLSRSLKAFQFKELSFDFPRLRVVTSKMRLNLNYKKIAIGSAIGIVFAIINGYLLFPQILKFILKKVRTSCQFQLQSTLIKYSQ